MGEISSDTKVHVLRGVPWKDVIIKLLEPDSPYRPWSSAADVEPGDAVIAILDTDPASVIAEIRQAGSDGRADHAIAGCMARDSDEWDGPPVLLELGTLTALTGMSFSVDGAGVTVSDAGALVEVMRACATAYDDELYLNGHTTLAAARILLRSGGRCTGCACELDLASVNARYHVHIHTVDVDPTAPMAPVAFEAPVEVVGDEVGYGPDSIRLAEDHWRPIRTALDRPAVLCDACHDRMRAGGFSGFLDFRFSLHPACPACSAHWTMRTIAGFIAAPPREPWIWHTGCCPQQRWKCGACGHNFGGNFEFGGQ